MTAIVLGIDPGTDESGWVKYLRKSSAVMECGVSPNDEMRGMVELAAHNPHVSLAVEMIQSYGMPVGQEVFETCVWIGRFAQSWRAVRASEPLFIYRQEVKLFLCGQPRAKDPNVRQALLDRFARTGGGAVKQVGTKAKPGPLFGMGTHTWPALGVAIVAAERINQPRRRRNI